MRNYHRRHSTTGDISCEITTGDIQPQATCEIATVDIHHRRHAKLPPSTSITREIDKKGFISLDIFPWEIKPPGVGSFLGNVIANQL
jgi:hypothetical protein